MKLAGEKTILKIDFNNITTRELNIESLESSLNSILNDITPVVTVKEYHSDISFGSGGALEGVGSENITGGEVNGQPSVNAETAMEAVKELKESITNISGESEGSKKSFEIASGSSVVYNEETRYTTVYVWYEGSQKAILWETGISSQMPFIYCIEYSTNGEYKTIRAYTTKGLHEEGTVIGSNNKWITNKKITDINRTVTSPSTGETYYIIAEDTTNVGSTNYDTLYWAMAISNGETWGFTDGYGVNIGSSSLDFFDTSEISKEDIANNEKAPIKETIKNDILKDEYNIDNITTGDGTFFTEEEITEIEEEVAKAIQEEITKIIEEELDSNNNYTEEEYNKIIEEITKEKQEKAQSLAKEIINSKLIDNFESEIIKQYTGESSLVLFKKNSENKLTDSLKKADETIKEVKQKYEELPEEEFKEYVENLDNGEGEAQKILDALGIDENTTQEDLNKIAEEAAKELIDAVENGKESDNEAVNAILDNLDNNDGDDNNDGKPKGLRYDIYNKIKSIADEGQDIDCIKYSTGIAEVVGKYFTTGVMHIAVHIGGNAIFGVGASLVLSAIQNLAIGMTTIQSGTKSINPIDQAQKLADGISNMYSQGIITSLVVGMMNAAPSPIPLVGTGMQTQIQHSSMKILIMISALAAFIMLAAGGIASMTTKSQKAFNSMLSAVGAKDGNDLFAMFLAAGIKASLITTIAKTMETTAGSTGTGLLIPFGP